MAGPGDDLLAQMIVQAGAPADAPAVAAPRPRATEVLAAVGVPAANEIAVGSTMRAPPKALPPGIPARLGRYEVLGEIGSGAAGTVLEGRDSELCRTVAIKVLHHEIAGREMVERFVSEAQVTAQLEHPNIVPIHDFGVTPEGRLYIVMKRVHGRSLHEILHALGSGDTATLHEWSPHRRLVAFVQLCRAVGYAHDRGVVHRDLKPGNLMFGAFGEALVMDWGIARVLKGAARRVDRFNTHNTEEGRVMGTIGYMCPEQMLGAVAQLGPPADVWSLGVILYEIMLIKRAFLGGYDEVCKRVTSGPLRTNDVPEQYMPREMGQIIETATSVVLGKRYPTAAQLADAVDGFLAR